ncbi:carbohydrate ABC transporter permease [Populibacterium corticicola]|uniref:Carbohydrate ABC transporter permease n=1 Tax=Populibacterium corticicola TaxID=1812826 RepID=A0ABW5XIQ9_9MICO
MRNIRKTAQKEASGRGILSESDWKNPLVNVSMKAAQFAVLIGLVVAGLGPILWLAKSAVTPTQDTLREPLKLWPNGMDWANLHEAWSRVQIDQYFTNTVIVVAGVWLIQVVVATTGGYVLSIMRPKYAKALVAMILATMFVPGIVLLVPLYLTVIQPPFLNSSLINTYWAIWLPAGANAFNILLAMRFFASLPQEIFEAAKVDGAGPYKVFFRILLPMSKPIIGVISVFAIMGAWKDYLWPMLVLKDPAVQTLSVRLPQLQQFIELDVFLAALAISTVIPVVLFIVFQRLFLSGVGMGGAVKG